LKTGEPLSTPPSQARSLPASSLSPGLGLESGSDTTDVIAEVNAGRTSYPSNDSSSVSSRAIVAAASEDKYGTVVARIMIHQLQQRNM
jgi:hypothetical protein